MCVKIVGDCHVEEMDIAIDGKMCKVNGVMIDGCPYVDLAGFIQAGYALCYDIDAKTPCIRCVEGRI